METEIFPESEESVVTETTSNLPEYCDPCQFSGTSNTASKYCNDCDERLCETCVKSHAKRKATSTHTPVPVQDRGKDKNHLCSPCKDNDTENLAATFCKECEEYLCEGCTKAHKSRKATKLHLPTAFEHLKEQSKQSDEVVPFCQPCSDKGKDINALQYCQICEEYLCEGCTADHFLRKATKSHTPVSVSTQQHLTEEKTKLGHYKFCDICLYLKRNEIAINFCQECKELLCDNCSKRHRTTKITKSHILISSEYAEYPPANCNICEEKAVMYCNECEEALCTNCATKHKKQKLTKEHAIEPFKGQTLKQTDMCNPCQEDGELKKADTYCKECQEYLCDLCRRHHKAQKITKHHELVSPESVTSAIGPVCDNCADGDTQIEAKMHCKDCELNLCDDCDSRHKRQKITKGHATIPISEVPKRESKKCEQCDEHADAIMYCSDCQDYLCVSCCKTHRRNKNFSTHALKEMGEIGKVEEDDKVVTQNSEKENDQATRVIEEKYGDAIQIDAKRPGKPRASDVLSDSITLTWDPPLTFGDEDYYQVSYKDLDHEKKWKFLPNEYESSAVILRDLKSNTKFSFRVRVVYEDGEGPYSEESETVITSDSPASRIVQFSVPKDEGNLSPTKYALPVTEDRSARNEKAKTKKFEVGAPRHTYTKSKTIMLVGATGTGKSTLVDGLVNYVLGVNWDDPFRFTVIDLEQDEKERLANQAQSQTEWITCYTLNPERGSRLQYQLTIIDTPGFGDTRGLKRDQEIVQQIRQLFSEKEPKGVTYIDAVCFLIKAPDARLTAIQSYIFQSVMSLFGKDIENNICSLITFADGIDPPVLAALNQSGLPFGKSFTFNNSGLFAKNVNTSASSLSPMFWDMGLKSFRGFFDHLEQVETKSLRLTKDVLDERSCLEATVKNLQPQLDAGLQTVNNLKQEIKIIEENRSLIKDNEKFEYEVEETRQKKKELPKGIHVTNCTNCHFTCHDNCAYANDDEKARCCAMGPDGNCKICPDKCHWKQHANTPYIFEFVNVKVKKTYADMQKKYQEATGKLLSQEQIVERLGEELGDMIDDIEDMMFVIKTCNERLEAIALRPNPLSMTEHIDLMIETEKMEKKDGYTQRINMLNDFKKRTLISKDYEALRQAADSTLETVRGKKKRDTKSIMSRVGSWLKKVTNM